MIRAFVDFALNNRFLVLAVAVILFVAGGFAFRDLPIEAYPELKSWGEANQIWIDASCELGQTAICHALTRAGLSVQDPAAFFFVSISGVASPPASAVSE